MNRNDTKKLQEIKRIESSVSSSSDTSHTTTDLLAEIAEPHLLLEENSFPGRSIITKDDNSKRIDTLIHMFKKEEEQPQKSAFSSEQHPRRTVTFDDKKTISNRSLMNPRLPNHDSSVDDQGEKESSDIAIDSNPMNFTNQDLYNLVSHTTDTLNMNHQRLFEAF